MTFRLLIALLFSVVPPACFAQPSMDIQPVKDLKPNGSLGTCSYKPTDKETPFFQRLEQKERATGSFLESYTIRGKQKKYVSWFGIVRGVADTQKDGTYTLLLEHKFFDGMTDCHIMMVSKGGSGDFHVTLNPGGEVIPPLVLLRIYGTVIEETNGQPHLAAEYVRVWPWLTFTFTDLGAEDQGNPQWKKYCQLCKGGKVYRPYPDKNYYLDMLGNPKDFGTL
jgi:hypothetical protein